MPNSFDKDKNISRRNFFPVLGLSFLLPVLGFGKSSPRKTLHKSTNDDGYQTLLKPDGTIVKVKTNTVKKSKVIHKKISNSSFLNWLGKKD